MPEEELETDDDFRMSVLIFWLVHLHLKTKPDPCKICHVSNCSVPFVCLMIQDEVEKIRKELKNVENKPIS